MNNIIFKTHGDDKRGNVFTVLYPYRVNHGGKIGLPPPYWFKKCWGLNL